MALQKFKFTALNAQRIKTEGYVYGFDRRSARNNILTMGYHPIKIVPSSSSSEEDDLEEITPILGHLIYKDSNGDIQINIGNTGPSNKEIIRFTSQLATD